MTRGYILYAALICLRCSDSSPTTQSAATSDTQAPPPMGTRVQTAVLHTTTPSFVLHLPGEVQGARDALLATALGGYVERVHVSVGASVTAGQSIAWVNKSIMDAHLIQTAAQLAIAKSDLTVREQSGRSVSRSQINSARLAVDAAQAAHRIAQINATRATIRAPFTGVIARLNVEEGEVLPPGGTVARLVQLDPVRVSVTASDRDVINITPGLAATVSIEAAGETRNAKVSRVAQAADIETRAFTVELDVANANHALLPGMITGVHITIDLTKQTIAIPQHVLVTRLEGTGVFVVVNDTARWRPVHVGHVINRQIIIEQGLSVGDVLVVTGHRELNDGDPVLTMRKGTCCDGGTVRFLEPEFSKSANSQKNDCGKLCDQTQPDRKL